LVGGSNPPGTATPSCLAPAGLAHRDAPPRAWGRSATSPLTTASWPRIRAYDEIWESGGHSEEQRDWAVCLSGDHHAAAGFHVGVQAGAQLASILGLNSRRLCATNRTGAAGTRESALSQGKPQQRRKSALPPAKWRGIRPASFRLTRRGGEAWSLEDGRLLQPPISELRHGRSTARKYAYEQLSRGQSYPRHRVFGSHCGVAKL